jgi:hypothetical protein
VSLVREGTMLWQAWQEIGSRVEASNGATGVSPACAGFVSNGV